MKRKTKRKGLVKKLDDLHSKYIKARDKKCVTCGSTSYLQNSHRISRRHYATRWCDINCNTQCAKCHLSWHGGFVSAYNSYIETKHGEGTLEELERRGRLTASECNLKKDYQLEELYEEIKGRYEELKILQK